MSPVSDAETLPQEDSMVDRVGLLRIGFALSSATVRSPWLPHSRLRQRSNRQPDDSLRYPVTPHPAHASSFLLGAWMPRSDKPTEHLAEP
jgi:hypothetical protein